MLPHRLFVLGGAASGKSSYAEAQIHRNGKTKVYLATAQIFDSEMEAKKNLHIAQRGPGWQTIEAPFDAADRLKALTAEHVCLFDCATMWLTNHMLADHDLPEEEDRLFDAMAQSAADIVIVSNEVGQGIVPDSKLGRQFREAQGRLNIRLARYCDTVVHVVAGLPNVLKGAVS